MAFLAMGHEHYWFLSIDPMFVEVPYDNYQLFYKVDRNEGLSKNH